MQRSLSTLLLALPPLLVACTTETSSSPSAPSAGGSSTTSDTSGATTGGTTGTTPTPPAANATSGTGTTEPAAPVTPKRDPQFDFGPGGSISDEELDDYHVVMSAAIDGEDVGTMTFEFWGDLAPITVRNFLRLVDEGFYDGLTFHRVLRNFMVQGGDPTGTGGGNSHYGTIQAEFSDDAARAHGYGVLSMARMGNDPDSASCQFFLCCDESQGVWGLDGQYSSFGRLTSGVAALEALADVEVTFGGREQSKPTKELTITRAEVRKGPAPTGETIERPAPELDLGGEPRKIVIQHVLISFSGTGTTATRTKEEAEALAQEVLAKAKNGEDFETLVRTHSDDPVRPEDENPGVYKLLNNGVREPLSERAQFDLQRKFRTEVQELQARNQRGELSAQEYQEAYGAAQAAAQAEFKELSWAARTGMVPAFGNVGFSLDVGEVGMAEFEATKSPYGWHIIKRLE